MQKDENRRKENNNLPPSLTKKETKEPTPCLITDRDTGAVFYGGDQGWYESNTMAYAGCGSVACANMLRILAHKYPEAFKNERVSEDLRQLTEESYYKDDFTGLMGRIYKSMLVFEIPVIRRIYDAVKRSNKVFKVVPASFGMSLNGFIRGTLKYCRRQGLLLHAHAVPTAFLSYDRGLDFIREGLDKGGSVVMLTSMNRHPLRLYSGRSGELKQGYDSKKGVKSHFMTITDIVESGDGEAPLIKLTTWGRVATVPYDKLNRSWHKIRAYTSCLYYFTPVQSEAVVRADIRKSYVTLIKAVLRGMFGWMLPEKDQ